MTPTFILTIFIGTFKLCGAPAVSLSFSSKSKSGTNVSSVFAFKNGSWVAFNSPHSSKGLNTQNSKLNKDNKDSKDDSLKASLTSDVEDLFRKINRTIPLKLLPASLTECPIVSTKSVNLARAGVTEKSLGDLFLEWLSKQEEAKPVAAKSSGSSTIPVLGLQIDFDDAKNTQRPPANREMSHSATRTYSPAQFKVSFREGPIFIHSLRKLAHSTESVRPFISHVKKRHQQRFYTKMQSGEEPDRPIFNIMHNPRQSTAGGDTQEFHSGQLLIHNESNEKKQKINDLPKYVMKFLSQCKALIEQNYEDEVDHGGKRNDEDEEEVMNLGRNDNFETKSHKTHERAKCVRNLSTETDTAPNYVDDSLNNDEDEFETLTINKKPISKISKIERKKGNSSSKPNDLSQADQDDADDLYDGAFDEEAQDWKVGENAPSSQSNNSDSTSKVTKQAYFVSETNSSTCRPIYEQFTPEKETFTADCSTPILDFSTLNPSQWKVLMDLLNERMPSTCSQKTTCAMPSTTKMTTSCTKTTSRSTCTSSTTTTTKLPCSRTTCTTPTEKTTCPPRPTCTTATSTTRSTCTSPSTCTSTCTGTGDDDDGSPEEPDTRQSNAKTRKLPQRYLIKIETTKPKRFHEGLMQGRKPNNWFENIRNLKLLEGLKSPNSANTVKPVYYNLQSNPNVSPMLTPENKEENTEKMIAEGVIPLKTGSQLNLYISYVLNKTKARRNNLPMGLERISLNKTL